MKIGLVLDDTLDTPDGVQQYVLALGGWLAARGHVVHYLVGQTARSDVANAHSLSKNLHVKFNGNRMSMPLPASRKRLKALLGQEHFDVLHVQVPYSPFMAGRLLRLAPPETAVVGTFHVLPYSPTERVANHLLALLNRRTAKRFTAMIAASAPAAAFAKSCYGFNTVVIPHPFDFNRFAVTASETRATTVVYLGRLVERKGVQYLLRALARLRELHELPPDLTVLIGGKGPLLRKLEHYAEAHELRDTVHFLGFVPEADKAELLARADVAVFPSVSGESFGISIIEALAATKGVVLAGNNPGYRAAMPIPDQLFDPTDINAFAERLLHWLEQPSERHEAAKAQRRLARQYDADIVCAKVLGIYEQALQSRVKS